MLWVVAERQLFLRFQISLILTVRYAFIFVLQQDLFL
jgi:hypothetical protein